MIDGKVSIYEGHLYESLLEKEAKVTAGRIEGPVASSGKAKGYARIVLMTNDIYKVNKGDIIIASMTTPNFIPAIEKCSAIVTDEGGILCHAAIVSREFRIPCVIGTGDATKRLDDGDLIEVDATGKVGIINILERR
jgi:pyruvate,water dikinase